MDKSYRSAQVHEAFGSLHGVDVYRQSMIRASKITMQEFLGDLSYRQQRVWRNASDLDARVVNRTVVLPELVWASFGHNQGRLLKGSSLSLFIF